MSRLPIAGPSLARRLRQQERTATREANASPFSRSGSGVTDVDEVTYEGVLKVLGQMVVDGTLVVNGPTTLAGALGVTGVAALDGDTTVGGTLTSDDFDGDLAAGDAGTTGWAMNATRAAIGELFLRPGSIGNDVLTAPVAAGNASQVELDFATSTSYGDFASAYIDVPAGFSRALVLCNATAGAKNTSAGYDYLEVAAGIDADTSRTVFSGAAAGFWAACSTSRSALLTGLSGGQIHVRCRIYTLVAGWSPPGSRAYTEAIAIFLR